MAETARDGEDARQPRDPLECVDAFRVSEAKLTEGVGAGSKNEAFRRHAQSEVPAASGADDGGRQADALESVDVSVVAQS